MIIQAATSIIVIPFMLIMSSIGRKIRVLYGLIDVICLFIWNSFCLALNFCSLRSLIASFCLSILQGPLVLVFQKLT